MIDKEELIERIENTLTTRTVKELFKSLVEQCRDVPIPNWQEEYESLVRTIGSITYGKERWFLQDDGRWYDRDGGTYITIDELHNRICEEVRWLDEN